MVYTDIEENTIPSDEYISSRVEIGKQRLCLAGYRIARTLLSLWSDSYSAKQEATFLN